MRFQPDTWVDAVLRPVAMAAPDAGVYAEIMAPDFRFLFALALLLAVGLVKLSRSRQAAPAGVEPRAARPTLLLSAMIAVAFVPWLATTGNGRYFVAALLIVGPVCIGLACLLPLTRGMRLVLAIGMVALQAFAMQQSAPVRAWTLASWKDAPYFRVDLPAELRSRPATYVTLSAITYSLLAPRFHPDSRWMSLHNAPAPDARAADARRTEHFLSQAQPGRVMLLVPVVEGMLTPQRLPNDSVSRAIEDQLAPYRLAFARPQSCRFLHSEGLADIGLGEKNPEQRAQSGFWLCELARVEAGPGGSRAPAATRHDAVFRLLETQCPNFLPAGGDRASQRLPHGEVRSYVQGEMKVYVYDEGDVVYKHYRALNPVRVGSTADLLAGRARLDCSRIRGRPQLPWQGDT